MKKTSGISYRKTVKLMEFKRPFDMKRKFTLLLVIFVNISYICFSQAKEGKGRKVESVQIIFFTKELALTPEETAKFWPIYNNYKSEIKSARKGRGSDQIALDEQILNIRKKYKNDFKSVLGSEERVNKMFVTERNFWEMLRTELLERQKNGSEKVPETNN